MESVLKLLQRPGAGCETDNTAEEEREILREIREVSRLLACNECWFQLERDSDLIEACIFQREELRARYRHLLNRAKQSGVNCALTAK